MAFLSSNGYDFDIFVSYAHVDDEMPLQSGPHGWVTTLRSYLKTKLDQKLGRHEAYALWMDQELRGGQPITPNILAKVQRSAILLVVLSPGYVASEWCRRELDTFARFIAGGERRSVFVVERDPSYETPVPSPLAGLKRSKFWVKDGKTDRERILGDPVPNDEYYSAVDDLVREIVSELKQIRGGEPRSAVTAPTASNGAVFLAEVTDDLDDKRNNVRRYLEQAGIAVLLKSPCSLHPDAFRQTVKDGLAAADLFVQLLSEIPGKRPPDLPEGYAKCQLDLALSLGKPILQWRGTALDTATVQDSIQRALLDGPTVRAEGIEEFKREIQRRLQDQLTPPASPKTIEALVFVDRESTDRPVSDELCDILDRYGAGYQVPTEDTDPRKFRKDLRKKIMDCNALILIYSATTRSWVEQHQSELLKMLIARPRPLRGKALVMGPPDPKDRLSIRLPGMQTIDCRSGVNEAAVKRFLESLESGAA